jgi:hypothetical protein
MPAVKGSVFEVDQQCASRVCAAGKLPGSVQTGYDLLGTYVRERLRSTY